MNLPQRLVALHRALARADLPHAFGGAIALAYCTRDPRGTSDIDVNLFVPVAEASRALAALPAGVAQPEGTVSSIERDGQVRLWWDETPVDLFFDSLPIHADASRHSRMVTFAGTEIPILGPVELAIFKAMFDRTRDWADIEAMVANRSVDVDAVREALEEMFGADNPRLTRLADAVRRGAAAAGD